MKEVFFIMTYIDRMRLFVLFLMKKYLFNRFDINVEKNDTLDLKPPYLLLSNHTNNWDPFLINILLDKPITYVTNIEFFRKKSTRYLLKFAGAIPIVKFMKGTSTIKKIIEAKKDKKIIGIFPEGRRNWDGETEEIIYSTAKLVKLLKIPVITTTLKGAHLSYPRWAKYGRWGKIDVSLEKILDRKRIANLSVDEIYDITNKKLYYNEYSYQKKEKNKYKGKKLAEDLELLLFTCPNCKDIGVMESKDDKLYCKNCSYHVKYNELGFFESNDKLYFNNPVKWNKWQLDFLSNIIKNAKDEYIIKEKEVELFQIKDNKIKKVASGNLFLKKDYLYFVSNNNYSIKFNLTNLGGLNIQYNKILEFFYADDIYRFKFPPKKSPFKWLKSVEISQKYSEEVCYG